MGTFIKLALVAALLAGGYFAYQKLFHRSEAYQAYERFADALVRDRFDEARRYATGDAVAAIEGADRTIRVIGGPVNVAQMKREIAGEVEKVDRKLESEEPSPEGDEVSLRVTQRVCRIPPGVATAMCQHWTTWRQQVGVVREEGSWIVDSFEEERVE